MILMTTRGRECQPRNSFDREITVLNRMRAAVTVDSRVSKESRKRLDVAVDALTDVLLDIFEEIQAA